MTQLYLHEIPVKFDAVSPGRFATFFDAGHGDWMIPVFAVGKDVYKCIGAPRLQADCPRCDLWEHLQTCEACATKGDK